MNLTFTITLTIIVITCLVSLTAFFREKVYEDFIFDPLAITYDKQWYRFLTCGLIHADYGHLFFNMFSLYVFGDGVEKNFVYLFHEKGRLLYLILYISALFACLIPTYLKHRTEQYRSLGASGAISAVIFAYIILNPLSEMGLIIVPGFRIRAFIFGFLYLVISSYLDKRGGGRINHSAHIFGALYGIAFLFVTSYFLSDHNVLQEFIQQIQAYTSRYF
ncbi:MULTISPECIES: rhomboid family intramembrane serine protease [Niastella]|uniref:Rhomboid family intramembrane serine protease n=1 Tax=Niastella soli TaxID=2821487 RepID=A0ABS3YYA3_9BACT|nr:rhomboid family intramembrane serine protease [Niastella soli]MBO9202912.1 rhomboid family intramembrane serine protease [Niastella soli]